MNYHLSSVLFPKSQPSDPNAKQTDTTNTHKGDVSFTKIDKGDFRQESGKSLAWWAKLAGVAGAVGVVATYLPAAAAAATFTAAGTVVGAARAFRENNTALAPTENPNPNNVKNVNPSYGQEPQPFQTEKQILTDKLDDIKQALRDFPRNPVFDSVQKTAAKGFVKQYFYKIAQLSQTVQNARDQGDLAKILRQYHFETQHLYGQLEKSLKLPLSSARRHQWEVFRSDIADKLEEVSNNPDDLLSSVDRQYFVNKLRNLSENIQKYEQSNWIPASNVDKLFGRYGEALRRCVSNMESARSNEDVREAISKCEERLDGALLATPKRRQLEEPPHEVSAAQRHFLHTLWRDLRRWVG